MWGVGRSLPDQLVITVLLRCQQPLTKIKQAAAAAAAAAIRLPAKALQSYDETEEIPERKWPREADDRFSLTMAA